MVSASPDFVVDGYRVVDGVIDDKGCASLIADLPPIESSGSRVLLSVGAFRGLAQRLRADARFSWLISDLVAIQCTLFRKSSDHNWAVRLHRDAVLPIDGRGPWQSAGRKEGRQSAKPPREFMDRCVAIRVHLDGAPTEDVSVVPGSHLDTESHSRTLARPVAVSRGGALIMRPTLAHASSKLRDTEHRRVLHYLYAPKDVPDGHRWHDAV
jgi:ectoine hydroxylase-related dioxygenase (phytanoyl-CoA dioxygenase family)